jgi:hypothetical protein
MEQPLPIYRFTFRPAFVTLLRDFSILHQQDRCKDFKEALAEWETKYSVAIREEQSYLESSGYNGDIHSKIFKSARYYLARMDVSSGEKPPQKEQPQQPQPRENETNTRRKTYTSISAELSAKIAEYLQVEEHCRLKPSDTFALFCQTYREETIQEFKRLRGAEEGPDGAAPAPATAAEDPLQNKQALLKIKKAFKNKHFIKKTNTFKLFN